MIEDHKYAVKCEFNYHLNLTYFEIFLPMILQLIFSWK